MHTKLATAVLTLALFTAGPALAAAHDHAGHGATDAKAVMADQVMKGGGLVGTLHVGAPAKPMYTCSMHPEVTAAKAGKCPTCKMALEKQTHELHLALVGADKKPVTGAKVHVVLEDANGMSQELNLAPKGSDYQGAFALGAGKHKLKAHVTAGKAKPVELTTTLVVK